VEVDLEVLRLFGHDGTPLSSTVAVGGKLHGGVWAWQRKQTRSVQLDGACDTLLVLGGGTGVWMLVGVRHTTNAALAIAWDPTRHSLHFCLPATTRACCAAVTHCVICTGSSSSIGVVVGVFTTGWGEEDNAYKHLLL
jgi:hypothetical protein